MGIVWKINQCYLQTKNNKNNKKVELKKVIMIYLIASPSDPFDPGLKVEHIDNQCTNGLMFRWMVFRF